MHIFYLYYHQKIDRKSTRLNSSHDQISYAVFCLKKKKQTSELQERSDILCRLLLEKKRRNLQVPVYTQRYPQAAVLRVVLLIDEHPTVQIYRDTSTSYSD